MSGLDFKWEPLGAGFCGKITYRGPAPAKVRTISGESEIVRQLPIQILIEPNGGAWGGWRWSYPYDDTPIGGNAATVDDAIAISTVCVSALFEAVDKPTIEEDARGRQRQDHS